MKNNYKKNISRNYRFAFLKYLDVTRGVWMLYLASKGLNLFQIGLMETVYHISSFLFEVPTGAVADIFGRKFSRSLGRMISIISFLLMIYSKNIYIFAIGFVFTALSNNLESGAGDALVYDSLKEIDEENKYMKVKGREEVIFQAASVFSLMIGGYIASMNYASVYKIAIVIALISFIQSLTFIEPTIGKVKKRDSLISTFTGQFKGSVEVIKNNKKILFLICFTELFSTFITTEFFYMQNLLKIKGYKEWQIGIVLAIGCLFAGIGAAKTHKIEKKLKEKGILISMSLLVTIGLWGMSINGFEQYAFIIVSIADSILFVAISDYLNKLIPSDKRATILSIQSMVFSVFMILLFPLVGKIGDVYGLNISFLIIAIISTIIVLAIIKTLLGKSKEVE